MPKQLMKGREKTAWRLAIAATGLLALGTCVQYGLLRSTIQSEFSRPYEADVVERTCGLIDGSLDPEPIRVVKVSPSLTAIKFVPEGASRPVLTYYDGGGGADGYSVGCPGTRFGDAVYDADRGVVVMPDGATAP